MQRGFPLLFDREVDTAAGDLVAWALDRLARDIDAVTTAPQSIDPATARAPVVPMSTPMATCMTGVPSRPRANFR